MTPNLYRNAVFAGLALLALGFVFKRQVFSFLDPTYKALHDAPRIRAAGGTFALTNIEWVKYFDQWEVRVVAAFLGSESGSNKVTYLYALERMCGELLTQMYHAPDTIKNRREVFRVALNFFETVDGKPTKGHGSSVPFVLPIDDGGCPNRQFLRRAYADGLALTYPEPLRGWRLIAYDGFSLNDVDSSTVAQFVWEGDGPAKVESFNFDAACQVAIIDSPRFSPITGVKIHSRLVIVVGAEMKKAGKVHFSGPYVQYLVNNGNCVRLSEGKLT
jgi:hypothetical protein